MKFSANEKLLNTFVSALKDNVRPSGILHPSFHQVRTATGRLSSSDPNFQNLPRDGGIKKVIVSRFENGKIYEVDFAQLEFRTAVFLAQDKQGMEDITNGVDVHQYTADIIGCSRQEAKAHTFKPLYGGIMGNENEKRYYKKFLEKYKDIALWHQGLEQRAIKYKLISIPSGREYHFPNVYRTKWGGCSHSTIVKNYPVQGFATADIVPIACINVWSLMKERNVKSLIINTVHDSVVIDVYPGEEDTIESIIKTGCSRVKDSLLQYYDCDFNVPLDIEIKKGSNWLDLEVA
jgi:DNA polymerase I-like protein with 3'-5' exonuclease and polymerase domains